MHTYQRPPSAKHTLRVRRVLLVWSTTAILIGFGAYFTAHAGWVKAGIQTCLFLVGVSATVLTRSGHLRLVALTLVVALIYVMQADLSSQRSITVGLRHAIARQQLQLFYQAQVDARGALVGAEALLRWHHPEEGMVSPADFIPVAESTGMIVPIGHWILGTACAQLVAWSQRPETAHLTLPVNVSAQQFKQSDFVTGVVSVLQRSGANAHRLKLELTESSLVNDGDDITTKMKQLQGRGLQLSLDDFGTGYSS